MEYNACIHTIKVANLPHVRKWIHNHIIRDKIIEFFDLVQNPKLSSTHCRIEFFKDGVKTASSKLVEQK